MPSPAHPYTFLATTSPTLHAQQAQVHFLIQAYPTSPQPFPAWHKALNEPYKIGVWHLPQESWCGESLVCLPWRRGSGVPSPPNDFLVVIVTAQACSKGS